MNTRPIHYKIWWSLKLIPIEKNAELVAYNGHEPPNEVELLEMWLDENPQCAASNVNFCHIQTWTPLKNLWNGINKNNKVTSYQTQLICLSICSMIGIGVPKGNGKEDGKEFIFCT